MKRVFLRVMFAVFGLITMVTAVAFGISALESDGRATAKSEILAAIDRMRSVNDFDDVDALLAACEFGAFDQRIDCRLGDYDVVYRGHRIKFTRIEVDYYRPMHGVYDHERRRYLPYMTGSAHIERRPQVQVVRLGS